MHLKTRTQELDFQITSTDITKTNNKLDQIYFPNQSVKKYLKTASAVDRMKSSTFVEIKKRTGLSLWNLAYLILFLLQKEALDEMNRLAFLIKKRTIL